MQAVVDELWSALESEWGEDITYTQGVEDYGIIGLRGNHAIASLGIGVAEISINEYDWLIHRDLLVIGSEQLYPARGDKITAGETVYEVAPRIEAQSYRFADQAERIFRVFTEVVSVG